MGEDFAGTAEAAPEGRDVAQLRAVYGMDAGFERELAEAWRFIAPHIAGVARELLERRAGGAVPAALVESRVDYARAKVAWLEAGQKGAEPLFGEYEECVSLNPGFNKDESLA